MSEKTRLMDEDDDPSCLGSCADCLHCCVSVCGLVCCPPCPSRITAKMAFMPPLCTYKFEEKGDSLRMLIRSPRTDEFEHFCPPMHCHFIRDLATSRRNRLAALFFEIPNSKCVILMSHGNAVDLGMMAPFVAQLSLQLECSLFIYDYSGYGLSTGRPLEKNVYCDAKAAIEALQLRFAVPLDQIIIYGQSIGSVPSIYLAKEFPTVRGLILHSPLASGLRVLKPSLQRSYCCDPFPNIDRIAHVSAPTFIIHGTEDQVVSFANAVALHQNCPAAVQPLWVPGAGHNDIEMYSVFFDRLSAFVESLSSSSSSS